MKNPLQKLSLIAFFAISGAYAQDQLETVPDGPPDLVKDKAAVVVDEAANKDSQRGVDPRTYKSSDKLSDDSNRLSTHIEEKRRRGTGINEVKVQYKNLPEYQLRKEIGDRPGEKVQSDLDTEYSIPQWQIGSW